jgi:hypothetical protein
MAPAGATYAPRDPSHTVLSPVIAEPLETLLASRADDPEATGLPASGERACYDSWRCGILAYGFLRLGCDPCHHARLVPFRGKRRGWCPACAGRRMAPRAAHLVTQVLPWVPTRHWGGGADPVALLDRLLTGSDRHRPYEHAHHSRAV